MIPIAPHISTWLQRRLPVERGASPHTCDAYATAFQLLFTWYVDLYIRGKGRRERVLTLWKVVGDSIRAWLAVRGRDGVPELFVNARGEAMTRSGAEYILRKYVAAASAECPSLTTKRVSPHVLRHTSAMNTLRATRDIRKVSLWLGHADTQSTEVYLTQDPAERLETLEAVVPPRLRPGKFTAPDKLLELLRGR